jgi:hypothetical protein
MKYFVWYFLEFCLEIGVMSVYSVITSSDKQLELPIPVLWFATPQSLVGDYQAFWNHLLQGKRPQCKSCCISFQNN